MRQRGVTKTDVLAYFGVLCCVVIALFMGLGFLEVDKQFKGVKAGVGLSMNHIEANKALTKGLCDALTEAHNNHTHKNKELWQAHQAQLDITKAINKDLNQNTSDIKAELDNHGEDIAQLSAEAHTDEPEPTLSSAPLFLVNPVTTTGKDGQAKQEFKFIPVLVDKNTGQVLVRLVEKDGERMIGGGGE